MLSGARHGERLAYPPIGWHRLSPSAELLVDARSGARCAIRNTRVAGAERYHWTVTVIGERKSVATGRAGNITAARLQAETALNAYSTDERGHLMGRDDTDG